MQLLQIFMCASKLSNGSGWPIFFNKYRRECSIKEEKKYNDFIPERTKVWHVTTSSRTGLLFNDRIFFEVRFKNNNNNRNFCCLFIEINL